jgi:hypothetical protein
MHPEPADRLDGAEAACRPRLTRAPSPKPEPPRRQVENRAPGSVSEAAPGTVSGSHWAPRGPGKGHPSRRAAGERRDYPDWLADAAVLSKPASGRNGRPKPSRRNGPEQAGRQLRPGDDGFSYRRLERLDLTGGTEVSTVSIDDYRRSASPPARFAIKAGDCRQREALLPAVELAVRLPGDPPARSPRRLRMRLPGRGKGPLNACERTPAELTLSRRQHFGAAS